MFKQAETLNLQVHKDLSFSPRNDFSFARHAVIAPLAAEEIGEASKYYPVVFAHDAPVRPIALLGIHGNSTFVEADGRWRPNTYIPAFYRAYPFAVGSVAGQTTQFAVVIDRAAPQFNQPDGQPLFTAEGKPAAALEQAQKFLAAMQQAADRGQGVLKELDDAGVLVPMSVRGPNKESAGLPQFRVVDVAKLAALSDETLLKWAKSGLLSLITLHRNSLTNLGFQGPAASAGATPAA